MSVRFIKFAAAGLIASLSLNACVPLVAGGMLTGAFIAADRRTSGTLLEDKEIILRIENRISAKYKDDAHINVNSFNRIVLLTGEVKNDEVRTGVEQIAKAAENVRSVVNESAVVITSSYADRSRDTYLAEKIRARYITDGHFQASVVSTVVERQEVFLMGLVTPAEGEDAARVASYTSGVTRVVKLFEYLDPKKMPPPPAIQDSATSATVAVPAASAPAVTSAQAPAQAASPVPAPIVTTPVAPTK
jgi:osmotically-inducible protein OsmY